jgi:predicted 2-oxoglutarate/Fe(II)-dependent dioxygenase YbiX
MHFFLLRANVVGQATSVNDFLSLAFRRDEHPDYYSSHKDTALLPGGTVRKLSFTIQLSDPESYDGGQVVLYNSLTDCVALTKALGSIVPFGRTRSTRSSQLPGASDIH